jgi:two-component system phosphate regulon sensor histidine kinase PhoR
MVLIDVTEKRQAEKMRQDFFANAGHELKTPLTAIIGFAELFENGLVAPDKRDDFMSKIVYEAKRMSAIINDILEISKLESSQLPEERSECDMLAIANSASESLMPLAKQKNVSVEITGNGFIINASQNHMHEIIDNILSNAIKYNKKNGKAVIDISQNESFGIITCTDTGIGIPYESQSRVFERFYRVDKGRSTKEGSTGLGLSIVKHIVNAYNGHISLSSRPSEGTTIVIKLPKK